MKRTRRINLPRRTVLALAALSSLLLCIVGCSSASKTSKKEPAVPVSVSLQSTNHVGGTHYRTIIHNGRWYQTFSNKLLVIDTRTGRALNELELCPFGTCGPAIDMAITSAGDML